MGSLRILRSPSDTFRRSAAMRFAAVAFRSQRAGRRQVSGRASSYSGQRVADAYWTSAERLKRSSTTSSVAETRRSRGLWSAQDRAFGQEWRTASYAPDMRCRSAGKGRNARDANTPPVCPRTPETRRAVVSNPLVSSPSWSVWRAMSYSSWISFRKPW